MASYRLLTYAAKGGPRAGILVGNTVYDAEAAFAGHARKTRKKLAFRTDSAISILRNWAKASPVLNAIARAGAKGLKGQPLGKTRLLAPIPEAGLIWCAGANYYDHVREMTGHEMDKSKVEPFFFIKAGGPAAVIGEGDTIRLPAWSQQIDWEAELAVVIGRPARNVKAADALKYVAGYTIVNDLSARDRGTREDWVFRFDWLRQKSFDGCCPMGPWIVPAAEIKDPQKLKVDLWIGNSYEQDTNTDQMVFSVAEQIEALSKQVTLVPGDIISTGTGAGCGRPKGKYMKPGDRVKITIEKVGTLNNRVAQGV
jgi:2-keto-4-pentenoate hydratase/2-oxohepta-3-ene-1,7-dioic acid hydratase in catechol pathway